MCVAVEVDYIEICMYLCTGCIYESRVWFYDYEL